MTTILIKSKNKKAINAIRTLAKELEMEVDETDEVIKTSSKKTWSDLVKSGIVAPANPSVKITEIAGIWTGKGITLSQIREKAWRRKVQ